MTDEANDLHARTKAVLKQLEEYGFPEDAECFAYALRCVEQAAAAPRPEALRSTCYSRSSSRGHGERKGDPQSEA